MIVEKVYAGNLGMEELSQFMDKATPLQRAEFQHLLNTDQNDAAMELVQKVTGMRLQPLVPEKKNPSVLMAFDFDNTLVVSDSAVKVYHADGSTTELSTHEYPHYKPLPGDKFDFSAFEKVKNPKAMERYIRLLTAAIRSPNIDVVITTARRNPKPIAQYLRTLGIEKGIRIAALGSGKPSAKLLYLRNKIRKGRYKDLYFFDDSEHNERVVATLQREFPDLGVRVHTHLVPPEEYAPLMGKGGPKININRDAVTKALDATIRNPETDNQILVRTALKYDKNHPAHKIARAYLSRVGRS